MTDMTLFIMTPPVISHEKRLLITAVPLKQYYFLALGCFRYSNMVKSPSY